MPPKTYVPQAVDEAQRMAKYFGRWQAKMTVGASSQQITALVNLAACLATFLQEWHKPNPNP